MANTSKRGFASMDPERRREIARKGGQHSHSGGRKSKSDEKMNKGGRSSRW